MKTKPNSDTPSDRKAPGFWFYPADYERDVQMLSLSAQGLWMRLMCWMSENEAHRGFLELPTGEPMSKWDIGSKVGKTIREVEKAIAEMEHIGIFSRDDRGCIYCRRMARETHISTVRRAAAASRLLAAKRAADGTFAGDFAGTNDPPKEEQNPTVTASVPVPVLLKPPMVPQGGRESLFDATPPPPGPSLVLPPVSAKKETDREILRWFEEEFWPLRWRGDEKARARKAALKLARTSELRQQIIAAVKAQTARRLQQEETYRPYMATWLNGAGWEDGGSPTTQAPPPKASPYRTAAEYERIVGSPQ